MAGAILTESARRGLQSILGGARGFVLVVVLGSAVVSGLALGSENWLAFGGILLVATIPLVVRFPVTMTLGLYVALVPFDSVTAVQSIPGGATLSRLVGAGTIAVLLAVALLERRLVKPPPAAAWWSLFVLWGTLTASWAFDTDAVLGRLPTAISLLALYLVVVSLEVPQKAVRRLYVLTCLGGVAAAMATVYTFMRGGAVDERASLEIGERSTDVNFLAASLLLPLAFAVAGVLVRGSWMMRAVALVATTAIATGIFLTMSRGAIVSLVIMAAVFVYRLRGDWRLIAALGVMATTMLVMPDALFERLGSVTEDQGSNRLAIWTVGVAAALEHGIAGAGLDNFRLLSAGWNAAAHNTYLGMLVEVGIVGLAFILTAIALQWRSIARAVASSEGSHRIYLVAVESGCLALLASGMFLDMMWKKPFWLAWMIAVLAVRTENSEHA